MQSGQYEHLGTQSWEPRTTVRDKGRLLTEAEERHRCPCYHDPWATERPMCPGEAFVPGPAPSVVWNQACQLLCLGMPEKGPVHPVLQDRWEESRSGPVMRAWPEPRGRAGFTCILEAGPWPWVPGCGRVQGTAG